MDRQFVETLVVEGTVNEQGMHKLHLPASAVCICADYEIVAAVFMHSAYISLSFNDMFAYGTFLVVEGNGERGYGTLNIYNRIAGLVLACRSLVLFYIRQGENT